MENKTPNYPPVPKGVHRICIDFTGEDCEPDTNTIPDNTQIQVEREMEDVGDVAIYDKTGNIYFCSWEFSGNGKRIYRNTDTEKDDFSD